ncbi:hypothetical protein [uncultured Tateyamaria sp.]|uniref:hypothetical protein n=1 Tax=uncultured Tateyamaria sp. TaxID=455651 RepID=UPI0026334DA3|nr:hypothetical protein [uncultured Tateyamaria sp.]
MTGHGNGRIADASAFLLEVWNGFRTWPDVSSVLLLRWFHDNQVSDTQVFGRMSPAFATEAAAVPGLEDGRSVHAGVLRQRQSIAPPMGGGVGIVAQVRAGRIDAVEERFGTLLDEVLLSLAQSQERQLDIALSQFDGTFAIFPDKARFLATGPGVVLSINDEAEDALHRLGIEIDAQNRLQAATPQARDLVRACDLARGAGGLDVVRDEDAQIVATYTVKSVTGRCAVSGAPLPLAVQVELRLI